MDATMIAILIAAVAGLGVFLYHRNRGGEMNVLPYRGVEDNGLYGIPTAEPTSPAVPDVAIEATGGEVKERNPLYDIESPVEVEILTPRLRDGGVDVSAGDVLTVSGGRGKYWIENGWAQPITRGKN